jgi:hypothetical protein
MYYIKKYGLDDHLKKMGIMDKQQYLNSLKGRVAFVLQTMPADGEFLEYKNHLKTSKKWNN